MPDLHSWTGLMMLMMSPRKTLAALGILLVALLSGCVGDEGQDHGDTEGTLPMTGEEEIVLEVVMGDPDEFRYVPMRLEVEEGQRVGVRLTNGGAIEHELTIRALAFHLHVGPGKVGEAAFVADRSGEFEFGCYIPGHYESGMHGYLTVR